MLKIFKFLTKSLLVLGMLFLLLDISLYVASSHHFFREKASDFLKNYLGREVNIKGLFISFGGIKLDGFSIANEGGFEHGTLLTVDRLRLRADWHHLLHGHLSLVSLTSKGLTLNVVHYKDGSFNFSSLLSKFSSTEDGSLQTEEDNSDRVDITLRKLFFQQIDIFYVDKINNSEFLLKNASVDVDAFSKDQDFEVKINAPIYYNNSQTKLTIPFCLVGQINLANYSMEQAVFRIENFSARYKDTLLSITGKINNFVSPQLNLDATITQLDNQLFKLIKDDIPNFLISSITLKISSTINLVSSTLQIKQFLLNTIGAKIVANGKINYSNLKYQIKNTINLDLDSISQIVPDLLSQYKMSGNINLQSTVTHENIEGKAELESVSFQTAKVGTIDKLNGNLDFQEKMTLKEGNLNAKLAGNLNQQLVNADLEIKQALDKIDTQLIASTKRFILPSASNSSSEKEKEFVEDVTFNPTLPSSWNIPPISLQLNLKADSVDVPYFYATNVAMNSNVEGITPQLTNLKGFIAFSSNKGVIKDLYKLTNANNFTKTIFLSLNIVGKVFNQLNVLSMLKGISKGMVSLFKPSSNSKQEEKMIVKTVEDEHGNTIVVEVPKNDQKMNGYMKYEQFNTNITFNDGVAKTTKSNFISDTVSFRLDGTTDFNSNQLNMTVWAAPGKHTLNGIMPLTIKIKGLISDPKASMSMIGTVSALGKQVVYNNFASNFLKKTIGKIVGIFKKKSTTPDSELSN